MMPNMLKAPEICIEIMAVETRLHSTPRDGYAYRVAPRLRSSQRWAVTVYVAELGAPIRPAWAAQGYRKGKAYVVAWAGSYKAAREYRATALRMRAANLDFLPSPIESLAHTQEI